MFFVYVFFVGVCFMQVYQFSCHLSQVLRFFVCVHICFCGFFISYHASSYSFYVRSIYKLLNGSTSGCMDVVLIGSHVVSKPFHVLYRFVQGLFTWVDE